MSWGFFVFRVILVKSIGLFQYTVPVSVYCWKTTFYWTHGNDYSNENLGCNAIRISDSKKSSHFVSENAGKFATCRIRKVYKAWVCELANFNESLSKTALSFHHDQINPENISTAGSL